MNKIIAQTIETLSLAVTRTRFDASEGHKNRNLCLLESPPLPPRKVVKTPKPFMKLVKRKGVLDVFHFTFPSRVETSLVKNNTVYGRYFKRGYGAPKSTVIMLHGMHARSHRYFERQAANLARSGHDCVIVTLPYHLERAAKKSRRGGRLLTTDLGAVFEGLQQAVKDVMAVINWLSASGEKRIGLLGISLGALVASIVASTTRKVNFLVLLAPATNPLQVAGYERAGGLLEERVAKTGLSTDQLVALAKPWQLKNHKPLVSPARTFIAEPQHDTLVDADSFRETWASWGTPRLKRYYHSRASILATRKVFKDVGKFLDETYALQRQAGFVK